jgi:hypothetical protein
MTEYLRWAVLVAGCLHFALLTASFSVPGVLRWRDELRKVEPLTRQLFLVHGGFIVFTIIAFGVISVTLPGALVRGGELGLALTAFIALFWLCRLLVQLFYFQAEKHLTHWILRVGYRGLTVLFLFFTVVYFAAAWANLRALRGI